MQHNDLVKCTIDTNYYFRIVKRYKHIIIAINDEKSIILLFNDECLKINENKSLIGYKILLIIIVNLFFIRNRLNISLTINNTQIIAKNILVE